MPDGAFERMLQSLDLRLFDAISSQTLPGDRRSLLAVQRAVRDQAEYYVYLEIGSHLGGTMQTHLADPKCRTIYSIDKRPPDQPDERGIRFGYPENSTARMLAGLATVAPEGVKKVVTFDADVKGVDPAKIVTPPDLCFIDGEHTTRAVLSDFEFCRQVSAPDAVIVLHDADIVCEAIAVIRRNLKKEKIEFTSMLLAESVYAFALSSPSALEEERLAALARREKIFFLRSKLWLRSLRARELLAKSKPFDIINRIARFAWPSFETPVPASHGPDFETFAAWPTPSENTRDLYLDLLKRCLVDWIHAGSETNAIPVRSWQRALIRQMAGPQAEVTLKPQFDAQARLEGRDWPADAHAMTGRYRLDSLQQCIESVLSENIPGDLMETGVWRGGASIFMRAVLKAHGVHDRLVWLADSFQGPTPEAEAEEEEASEEEATANGEAESAKEPAAEEEVQTATAAAETPAPAPIIDRLTVETNFQRYGLFDEQVRFIEGWLSETLPTAPVERIAVLRIDGVTPEETALALDNLYPKLSVGGYIIIDDFGAEPACRLAVEEFRTRMHVHDEIRSIDWTGVYWRKSG